MIETEMTPQQKAGITRHSRTVEKHKRFRAKIEERELIRATLTAVIKDEQATTTDKVEAARLLLDIDEW